MALESDSLKPRPKHITPPLKSRLSHRVPNGVPEGETFHIRIRVQRDQAESLSTDQLGSALLESVRFYHQRRRWHCQLFVLMPDHLHALLVFPRDLAMSRVIGEWKHYHAVHHQVKWQDNYFDHRIRNPQELTAKAAYIRANPVVKKLCDTPESWPWTLDSAHLT